jgi:hypothetical protein
MDEKDNASLERGADNDIVRLRWRLKVRENVVARLQAENKRLRLSVKERDAIDGAAATLRNLLARLS